MNFALKGFIDIQDFLAIVPLSNNYAKRGIEENQYITSILRNREYNLKYDNDRDLMAIERIK